MRSSPREIITRAGASIIIATSGLGPTPHPSDFQPTSELPESSTTEIVILHSEPMQESSVQIKDIVVNFPEKTPRPDDFVFRDFPNSQPTYEKPVLDIPQPTPGEIVLSTIKRTTNTTVKNTIKNSESPCGYDDIPTRYTSYSDWRKTLVDTIYMLPSSYYPPDLVSTGLNSGSVRSLVITDLRSMADAARLARVPLAVQSAFRSYAQQVSTFNSWVSKSGYQAALLASARPGHSEHQLGTTIDFRGVNDSAPWNYSDWAKTATGAWMAQNAWKYGFIMSYPAGVSPSETCYKYEPWHYRYVGREQAAAIHASGLSPRKWLMQNYPVS